MTKGASEQSAKTYPLARIHWRNISCDCSSPLLGNDFCEVLKQGMVAKKLTKANSTENCKNKVEVNQLHSTNHYPFKRSDTGREKYLLTYTCT
jgi:hypothetical protein